MSACGVPGPSGGTNPSVPTKVRSPTPATRPMSASLQTPPQKMMFDGLMSRCVSPRLCM